MNRRVRRNDLEGMRALLRGSLGKSLRVIGEEDRLTAAWTVVCGRVLSQRGTIAGYADGVVEVEVVDAVWMQQMRGMRKELIGALGTVANVPVREIQFAVRGRDAHSKDESGLAKEGRAAGEEEAW